ncbi:hypothetical protein QBC45DRAFT_338006, partial [Copromyces sp. CBS 386.78]
INVYCKAIYIEKPRVIIIDYNIVMKVVVKRVYPQLYIFYVNKNIVLNIKYK